MNFKLLFILIGVCSSFASIVQIDQVDFYGGDLEVITNCTPIQARDLCQTHCDGATKVVLYSSTRVNCYIKDLTQSNSATICTQCQLFIRGTTIVEEIPVSEFDYIMTEWYDLETPTNDEMAFFTPSPFIQLKDLDSLEFKTRTSILLDQFISEHPDQFAGRTFDKQQIIMDIYDFVHHRKNVTFLNTTEFLTQNLTPCQTSLAFIMADAINTALQVYGMPSTYARTIGKKVISKLAPQTLIGLQWAVKDIASATTLRLKATAVVTLATNIISFTGIQSIVETMYTEFSWYDWVLVGVTISSSMVAMFTSDGILFAANVLLLTSQLATDFEDAKWAIEECSK